MQTVKHQSLDLLETDNQINLLKSTCFKVFKVQNFVGQNKLVLEKLVSGVSWSERTNSGMVRCSGVTIDLADPTLQGAPFQGGAKLFENVGHLSENLTEVLA